MNNPILIFDFDGTIADTHQYIVDISNRLSNEFQYKEILPHEVIMLKDKTAEEVIRHLNVPVLKIPAIIAKAKKELQKNISEIKLHAGLKETLLKIKKTGNPLGILSTNSTENITSFLKLHQLDIFDFIHSTSKVWSKNTALKKLINKNNFEKNQVIYIGDEIRDVLAAQRLGIKMAAVAWGYNSLKSLQEYSPDFLINTPDELIHLCDTSFQKNVSIP